MLQYAFKEWAVICEALGQGKQAIILRKGGIAEPEGEFGVAETRFWLYPTYVHQQESGIQEELQPLLEQVKATTSSAGKVRLQYWADVSGGYHLRDEIPALLLSHLHFWSEETVRQRFHYRKPGIFVLVVRVHRLPAPIEIDELPSYAGCRSWVELEKALPTEGSTPVLSDEDFRVVRKQLDTLLSPSAFA
jgi:hypothetical protein